MAIFRRVLTFALSVAAVECASSTWTIQGAGLSIDFRAYYACLDQEAATAVKKSVESGAKFYDVDTRRIRDEVFALCTARFSHGVAVQAKDRESAEIRAKEALNTLMRADIEKQLAKRREAAGQQAARDAPKLKAESAAAWRLYGDCVFNNARAIAVASTETAQVVREAAFAACREERQAVLEVHRRYKDEFFDEGVLDKVDEQMAGPVLLEIIKMRKAAHIRTISAVASYSNLIEGDRNEADKRSADERGDIRDQPCHLLPRISFAHAGSGCSRLTSPRTRTRPCVRPRGLSLIVMSTSWPSAASRRIRRSLEKFVSRPLNSADTLG